MPGHRDRTAYMRCANDEAFNGARFRGTTLYKLSQNCDHFVASRGRVVVKDGPGMKALTVLSTAVTREYVFDRREQENVLYAQATIGVSGVLGQGLSSSFKWRIDTDEVGGGSSNTGEDEQTQIVVVDDAVQNAVLPWLIPTQWPNDMTAVTHAWLNPVKTQWQKHTIPAATARVGTVVSVVFEHDDVILDQTMVLRGLTIIAVREISPT